MSEPVFVIGASGHAGVIIDILESAGVHPIRGLIDSRLPSGTLRCGYSVLGDEDALPALMRRHDVTSGIVAIGDNFARARMVERIQTAAPGFRFIPVVHPSAQVARDTAIGAGAAILAGAVAGNGVRIGAHVILNVGASATHDCILGDYCSLGPGATLGGGVRVGEFTVIAQGANVIHGRTVGRHTVLGAGAVLLRDLPEFVMAWGVPARVIRERKTGEPYL